MNERRKLLSKDNPFDPITGRGIIDGYEAVDLGLPSGTLWATCNVGANTQADLGNYYQYGLGSEPYNFSNPEYTGTENPLDSSKDTARQVWGSQWHMPTETQFNELLDNTDLRAGGIDESSGWFFTSKTDNSKYVYFPHAGYWDESGDLRQVWQIGYYWSSNPAWEHGANALTIGFGYEVRGFYRNYGFPVRPVHDAI